MRPSRLVLSGFTAFRQQVEVDFSGADLFALTGPTGSGKTSLIDAICFALYGAVPRLSKNAVEPVVSLGTQEARVLFEFEVDGTGYTAARVVRRTKAGATTAEARLEGGPEAVVGADEVTAAVENLLGFGFDHFVKCVVLPQGEFAAFLHDTPARRQDLLRRLLDLGVYERMRHVAARRQAAAEAEAGVLERQIQELSRDEEEERRARARLQTLTRLREETESVEPRLEELRGQLEALSARRKEREAELARLEGLEAPSDLRLVDDLDTMQLAALEEARSAWEEARAAVEAVEVAVAEAVPVEELVRLSQLHRRRHELEQRRAQAEDQLAELGERVEAEREELELARRTWEEARRRREAAERALHAHVVAAALAVGEPCPVCLQPVEEIPDRETPSDLDEAQQAERRAQTGLDQARGRLGESEARLLTSRERLDEMEAELTSATRSLEGHPGPEEIATERARRQGLERELEELRRVEREARAAEQLAAKAVEEARARQAEARRTFDRARDRVAALDPPSPERHSLTEDWEQLLGWRDERRRTAAEELERIGAEEGEVSQRLAEQRTSLDQRFAELQLALRPEASYRDVCFEAETLARREVERLEADREAAAKLAERAEDCRRDAAVARTLARHLSASGFEAWILEEALLALVAGANRLLADLTSAAYSLEVQKRDFAVVDHRNADEVRSVKTLSGGETFLVSLALALALAEQLALLSAGSTARLESLFLDEGFGTLDGETLDVVASVIHELGASGRVVCLVTHVKELAEQVPVRFEVRRGPGGATVQRVET